MTVKPAADLLADLSAPYTEAKYTDFVQSRGGGYEVYPVDTDNAPYTVTTSRSKFTGLLAATTSRNFPDGGVYNVATQKFTPEHVDAMYMLRLDISCQSATNGNNALIIELDIGGAAGVVATRTILTRTNVAFSTNQSFPIFCGSTFLANGGEFYVRTTDANFSITNGALVVFRL